MLSSAPSTPVVLFYVLTLSLDCYTLLDFMNLDVYVIIQTVPLGGIVYFDTAGAIAAIDA